jgi:hypothetical protein
MKNISLVATLEFKHIRLLVTVWETKHIRLITTDVVSLCWLAVLRPADMESKTKISDSIFPHN